jgi:transposase
MTGVEKWVIVANKVFFSSGNVRKLKRNHLSHIIMLRRISSLILESEGHLWVFRYDGRHIKY